MKVRLTVILAKARKWSASCLSSEFGVYLQNVGIMQLGEGVVPKLFRLTRLSDQAERVRHGKLSARL